MILEFAKLLDKYLLRGAGKGRKAREGGPKSIGGR